MFLRLGVAVLASAFAASPAIGPPAGLTAYGRVVWNLDALLHDTFGDRQVWEDYGRGPIPNFSTKFIDLASSVPWAYTFATARRSQFRAVRPRHPPKIGDYVTGENVPFRIRGAYIACGNGEWLYGRNGQALPGGDIWCSRTP